MEGIGRYLITLTGAAALCAVIRRLTGESKANRRIIDLMTGVFLTLVVVSPLKTIKIAQLPPLKQDFYLAAEAAAQDGTLAAAKAAATIIKEQTEAYILDKAQDLHAQITVEVGVSQEAIPAPQKVTIIGDVSPYAKNRLKTILKNDLGLGEEVQTWI